MEIKTFANTNSLWQSYATQCLFACLKRGNKARKEFDDRCLKEYTFQTEYKIGNKRADCVADITYVDSAGDKLTERHVFEIKSGARDLNSGYGMNLFGEQNYVVIPSRNEAKKWGAVGIKPEIVEAYLYWNRKEYAGILIVDNGLIYCYRPAQKTSLPVWLRWLITSEGVFGDETINEATITWSQKAKAIIDRQTIERMIDEDTVCC